MLYGPIAFFLILLTTVAAAQPADQPSLQQQLRDKRDRRRVLLIYSRTAGKLADQLRRLESARADLSERDLDLLPLDAATLPAADRQWLTKTYRLRPDTMFRAWLIGKDGGVKETYTEPVAPNQLAGLIDTMPMRRQEMRRNQ